MAGYVGKLMVFKVNTGTDASPIWTKIGGLQTKSFEGNNQFVEITNDDSAYGVEYLAGSGVTEYSISGEGVAQDDAVYRILSQMMVDRTARGAQFYIPGTGTFEGKVLVSKLANTSTTKAEVRYSITLIVAEGGLVYTPGS